MRAGFTARVWAGLFCISSLGIVAATEGARAADWLRASQSNTNEPLRTWTSSDGNRRAQARLVAVDGAEVRLVSAAGRPARTMLDALSEHDREYIENYSKSIAVVADGANAQASPKQAAAKQSPEAEKEEQSFPIVRGVLDKLPGVPGALSKLATPDDGSKGLVDEANPGVFAPLLRPLPAQLPADLIHMRVSRAFLENFVERDVNRNQPIRDNILGTSISGQAQTRGTTQLILHPREDQAIAEVVLRGTIQSQTIGYNGPVRLHCTSQTPFESHKFIFFGPNGIHTSESQSTARLRSTTHHVVSTLPGLRGRIATRIGWRRVGEMKSQGDAIASRHTEQRLNQQFNQSVERSIALARQVFRGKIDQLPSGAKLPPQICYRSTPEYLEMVLRSQDAAAVAVVPEPRFDGSADIAIRVHRSVVRNALTDPTVRKAIRPLLAGLLPLQAASEAKSPEVLTSTAKPKDAPEFHISWSDDQDWIEINFSGRDANNSQPVPKLPAKHTVVER
jgi:hypothetical protein